jgi:hypothetical protein
MMRNVTALEAALGIALFGSVLAVAVPAFVRNLSASRLTEATHGLTRIGESAVAGATGKPCAGAFPDSAPLTPAVVPRGKPSVDPEPDPWQHPTWMALDFRPSAPGVAHSFAFAFDRTLQPRTAFVASAHGDLNGNGTTSTFEVRGQCEDGAATLVAGMYVQAELE